MPAKKLEGKILESIERIANIGHWRYDLVNDSLYWSEEVYRIHGLNFDDYTPNVDVAIDAYLPEDRDYVEKALQEAIEKREPFEFEKRIRRPDGEIRYVSSRGECEIDFDGSVISIFGTFQDLTELRMREELYELAAISSGAALWDWDIKSDRLNWAGNSAEILGYTNKKDLPRTTARFFSELVHPDDHEYLKNAFTRHFKTREPFSIDIRLSRTNKNYKWFSSRAQAHWDMDNQAIRMCGSLYDIDLLKQTQGKLERSNNDLSQFATIAAHDLKAPLRAISGFLEILQNRYKDKLDEKANEYINFSVNGAAQMGELIDDLLEYARLKSDEVEFTQTELNPLIQNVIDTIIFSQSDPDIAIEVADMPPILADANKVRRVFHNLIENALKYKSEHPPKITIKAEDQEDIWQFSVQDNGIGIDPSKQDDVFLMFKRLHTKDKYSGTGIGLAICKRIVELHGGDIWVESEPNKGSIFYFSIPKRV